MNGIERDGIELLLNQMGDRCELLSVPRGEAIGPIPCPSPGLRLPSCR